jgi:hypothetical protein
MSRTGWKLLTSKRSHLARYVGLLHSTPGAMYVTEGLVNQVKVQVVELQPLQRSVDGLLRAFVPCVLDP